METSSAPGPARVATSATARSMRALRAHRWGGAEQFVYEQAPRPPVGIGYVLVEVHAASFTPTELAWPSTWTDRLGRDRRPVIPAHEVSGVVAALGYGTSGLSVGDEVYGLTDWYRAAAAADYVAVESRNLAPRPTSVDHLQAAAVPLAGLTAFQALFDHGRLQAGQTVLVQGAGRRGRHLRRTARPHRRRPGAGRRAGTGPGAAGAVLRCARPKGMLKTQPQLISWPW